MTECFTVENSPGVAAADLERLNAGWREHLSYKPELLKDPAALAAEADGYRAQWLKRLADAGLVQEDTGE